MGIWRVEEAGGGAPGGGGFASPAWTRHAAALTLDVPVQVVRAGEALVAVLTLVGPYACMDTQMVLQVVVVHKFGVAVQAHVGSLARVLAHVDL